MENMKSKIGVLLKGVKDEWKALLVVVFCNIVSAFAVMYFTLPYRFPDTGVTGLAVLSNYVFGISPSWGIFFGNMLLLWWGYSNLNLRFLGLTVCSIIVFSVAMPIFRIFPSLPLPNDRFMAAILSGILRGMASAMIFRVGGSGGGTDIIAMVLRRRRGWEVGRFSIYINLVILAMSLSVVGLESVVYGVVCLYVFGVTLDNAMHSFDRRKQAFIITNIPDEVSHFITSKGKGVTIIDGRGGFTGESRQMLISLLEPRHVLELKTFLREKDPKSFVSICDASEVVGQGFKSWTNALN
ncbi:membrane protein [Synergistales bacterium]|nr:membrane protein [Synergistales bacterium]